MSLFTKEEAVSSEGVSSTPYSSWRSYPGIGVTVYAPHDSYAARCASRILSEAEHILAALHTLLTPDQEYRDDPIAIFVTDTDPPGVAQEGDLPDCDPPDLRPTLQTGEQKADAQIVLTVQPEAPEDSAVAPLTRHWIQRWFGPDAASAYPIVEGIIGLIAARTRLGPSIEETQQWVQAEMEAGRPVSILSHHAGNLSAANARKHLPPQPPANTHSDPAATSFLAFLVANYGPTALITYLQTYDPARHDAATLRAYQRPLGVLEENWLVGLRRRASHADALRSLLARLIPLLKSYRRQQLGILFYLALAAACNVAIPLLVKYFLKDFQAFFKFKDQTLADAALYFHATVLPLAAALGGINTLSALVSVRRAQTVNWLNQTILNDLQLKLFTHLQRMPHSFYERAKIGDLMTRLTDDLDNVQSALSQLTNKSLYQIFQLIGGVIGLFLTIGFSVLTLLVLLIVPLFALGYTQLRTQNKIASREQRKRVGQTATAAQEMLSAHAVIKAFRMEERVIAAFADRIQAQKRSKLRLALLGALTDLSEDVASALAQLLLFGVGGYLVLLHPGVGIHIEDLIAALLLVKYIIGPIASLSGVGQTLYQASGAMERVNELFEEPITIADKQGACDLPPPTREIRLENVTFGYEARYAVLHDLSLTIPAGANVAIVGPSGSGKSTIIHLLMRFSDPVAGRVRFDSRDLRDVTLASLRDQIGLVFQDTFVFDTTVGENIAIGRPQATDAEIMAAARAARLDEDIQSMPAGYDTVLGERGVRMSGGQRQRLAIARVMLRNPKVLILDEAASALDAQTEAGILDTLSTLRQGRTVISVTHRLSWAKDADIIFVLDEGRLVEQGTHHALVSAGGLYQRLYEEQIEHVAEPALAP